MDNIVSSVYGSVNWTFLSPEPNITNSVGMCPMCQGSGEVVLRLACHDIDVAVPCPLNKCARNDEEENLVYEYNDD